MATAQSKGISKASYNDLVSQHRPARPIVKNTIRAFLVGGCVCLFGQIIQVVYIEFAGFKPQDAGNPTVATLIFFSVLFTALGVYDRFAQWAGAGSAVPVTGFANSMASAAMEHRSEGWVPGIGGNMFKIAGPVIVYGVVSAFVIAILRYFYLMIR